ncbi:acetylornithine deacetylase or succinyl-diaminopimelate desuccinylase [Ancylobacter novellus DSM 506]|uniref:Acetylornithine deacetylase or succinyl-diaminopimelate desuccinylase n=1 Tax=Ancylobacter novellus (strain ATCC 8093 / DSM 506 / JCM 20403 / CCM 1077 / IAM 12100 / NBRC 12443 / NCIMB 10456) TaxID=639283 RepID=D7A1R8_ANCN5|nr:ArgE/DapE family deacylase [Ancylobacter novellus]ADH91493.1 acetylornithine deacetylase or succinyl-diaminopimelate desuccinylase [Ancylobacter novellus DSM 506]
MSTVSRQDILSVIDANRDQAVAFLQKMVSIPSVTGDEAAIQDYLSKYMAGIGLDVDMWETDWEELKKHPGYRPVDRGYENRPNIVATWKGQGGGRSLLLNGHTDVIPVGNGEGWSDNPWSAAIKDGRVYGRGSCDMKSGVASHILAVQFLQAAGVKLKGDVYINVVIDEEVSGHGTLDTVIRGYKADAGISGETSDLAVQPACIGRIWFEIEIQGKPAGVQQRYLGVSGIELGYKITQAVNALEAHRVATVSHPLYPSAIDSLPCLIGSFQAGNYPSAFPATCLLKGSIGTVPGEDHEGVKQSLVDQIAKAAAEDPWMKDHPPVVRFVGYDAQASEIPRDHAIVTTVSDVYKEITGKAPVISGRQGAADTRFLNLYADTPTVIFGPGSTAVMHANDEYVSIDDYVTAIKVMALSILDWCEAAEG